MSAAQRLVPRLLFLLTAVALLATFACRPAWRPDGSAVLFPARSGADLTIAHHDCATGMTRHLFRPPSGARATALWSPDGKNALMLWAKDDRSSGLHLRTIDVANGALVRDVQVPQHGDAEARFMMPPVVIGEAMFFANESVTRVDLRSGAMRRSPGARGEQITVAPLGPGLCYVSSQKEQDAAWEFGRLDPETLDRTPVFAAPTDLPWRIVPIPAVTKDGKRVAFAARALDKAGDVAILIFRDGRLENALPIGKQEVTGMGPIAWLPDDVTLVTTLLRRGDDDALWSLFETNLAGSVVHETRIASGRTKKQEREATAFALQPAVAPDGRTVALTTAMLDGVVAEQHGLYLVERAGGRRRVKHFPFPELPEGPHVMGSDTLLQTMAELGDAYAMTKPCRGVASTGGGSAVGIVSLIEGSCDLAMMTRAATPAEQKQAADLGVALVEHKLGMQALAVCVHADNGLPALTLAQLAQIFGGAEKAELRWADFGATMPAESSMVMPMVLRHDGGSNSTFRQLALQGAAFRPRLQQVTNVSLLLSLVRSQPGAIVFLDRPTADDTVRIVPIAKQEGEAAVLPEGAALHNGSYPLVQPVLLYSRADKKPEVAAFLTWLQSDAGRTECERLGIAPPPR